EVQATETRRRGVDQTARGVAVVQVGAERERGAARGLDEAARLLGLARARPIVHGDVHALPAERHGDGAPDSLRRPGDQRALTPQVERGHARQREKLTWAGQLPGDGYFAPFSAEARQSAAFSPDSSLAATPALTAAPSGST